MQVKDLIQLKGKKFAIDVESTGLDLLEITGKGIYAFLAGEDLWYVGSTLESFGKRWGRHLSALRKGNHDNKWLQRVWNKHGKIYAIILEVSDRDLPNREQYWIDWFKDKGEKVCNMQPANQSRKGIPHTEETKIKISNKLKGNKNRANSVTSPEAKARLKAYANTPEERESRRLRAIARWKKQKEQNPGTNSL